MQKIQNDENVLGLGLFAWFCCVWVGFGLVLFFFFLMGAGSSSLES